MAAVGLAASASAQLTWDWTLYGEVVNASTVIASGSGEFTTASTPVGGNYQITSMTGSIVMTFSINGTGAIQQSGGGTILGITSPPSLTPGGQLTGNLIVNLPGGDTGTFYVNTGNPLSYVDSSMPFYADHVNPTFNVQQVVSAPEPSQVASMLGLAGVGGTGMLLRFRRRK